VLPEKLAEQRVTSLAAGGRHTLLCTHEGQVWAWGRGVSGCLGAGPSGCTAQPIQLRSLELGGLRVATLACGGEHSAILTEPGALYTFGLGKRGQLGTGSTDSCQLPVKVSWSQRLPNRAVQVSCGASHTGLVLVDGSLLTCGSSEQGVLGHGAGGENMPDCLELRQVAGLSATKTPVASVSCGGVHTLVLTRASAVYGCGAGSWGRLGLGGDNKDKPVPTLLKAAAHLGGIKQVVAGHEHSLLLTQDGSVFQFGRVGSSYAARSRLTYDLGAIYL
jgi:alpha-tubulin suppressor-like RCC1 family protein